MQRFQKDELEWLEFELLQDCRKIKHSIFLRTGGVSVEPFASLNTGLSVGDDPKSVQINLKKIETYLTKTIPYWKGYVWGKACHGTSIASVASHLPATWEDYDGLMTKQTCTTLLMKHADCQIALFYDPVKQAIANVHAGWRGSVANIYQKTIEKMQQSYGSHPANLLVCITPSLGPEKAEFIHYKKELPVSFWPFQIRPTYFDFWAISENQLKKAGILSHHIEIARLCTFSESKDYFSYRRACREGNSNTGRHATCITLVE